MHSEHLKFFFNGGHPGTIYPQTARVYCMVHFLSRKGEMIGDRPVASAAQAVCLYWSLTFCFWSHPSSFRYPECSTPTLCSTNPLPPYPAKASLSECVLCPSLSSASLLSIQNLTDLTIVKRQKASFINPARLHTHILAASHRNRISSEVIHWSSVSGTDIGHQFLADQDSGYLETEMLVNFSCKLEHGSVYLFWLSYVPVQRVTRAAIKEFWGRQWGVAGKTWALESDLDWNLSFIYFYNMRILCSLQNHWKQ
jgi:hypothetical protein